MVYESDSCLLFLIVPGYLPRSIVSHSLGWACHIQALLIKPALLVIFVAKFVVIIERFAPLKSLAKGSAFGRVLVEEELLVLHV